MNIECSAGRMLPQFAYTQIKTVEAWLHVMHSTLPVESFG